MSKYTESQKNAAQLWDKTKSVNVHLKFSADAHPEVVKKLSEVPSKTKYILDLIENDIRKREK